MMKVKTFVMRDNNPLHHDDLDKAINSFLAENDIEVIDIKYSSSLSADNGRIFFFLSAMLIYRTKE